MPKRATSADVLDELRDLIRARKLRATPARLAVLELLRDSAVPLSHDEVLMGLGADICDRSTIYRVLNQLATARLVRRADLGDHVWRFSVVDATGPVAAYRADFVCSACGNVFDLTGIELSAAPAAAPRAVARGQIEVHLIGRCNQCQ